MLWVTHNLRTLSILRTFSNLSMKLAEMQSNLSHFRTFRILRTFSNLSTSLFLDSSYGFIIKKKIKIW